MNKKFRIWNKPKNRFVSGYLITEDGLVCLIEKYEVFSLPKNQDDYVVQQWTGLTDSQGVEIYEGDIVDNLCRVDCAKLGGKIYKGCIPGDFSIEESVLKEAKSIKDATFDNVSRIGYYKIKTTIVGNIFQTPELLEKVLNF